MFGMRKRTLLVEKFINFLIVLRIFTSHLLQLEIYLLIIAALLIAKFIKEGFTPIALAYIPILAIQIIGEVHGYLQLQYISVVVMGLIDFFAPKLYWIPEPQKMVGHCQDSIESGLHYFQFFPLDESQPISQTLVKWHQGRELTKMIQHQGIKNKVLQKLAIKLLSFADKHFIKIGEGKELKTDSSLVFSHGRGATPFMYSSILMYLASLKYKVGSIQHVEYPRQNTKLSKQQAKKYRQKQVQVRALELYQVLIKLQTEKIVMMGHSYGCATVIQAYHSLEPKLREKVRQIILLDPWFFPLSDHKFQQKIDCSILILANEDFIKTPDMFQRNRQFLKLHKVDYVLWKNGHHLHQTDLGFLNGNLMGAVKNSHLSQLFLDLNIQAITKFLKGEQVEGTFGQNDLGRDYTPSKFYPQELFKF